MNAENLVAACGLYCGACEMYRADHDNNEEKRQALLQQFAARGGKFTIDDLKCDGCLGHGRLTPFCRACEIRVCPQGKSGVTHCSDCPDFPCSRITNFNNDGNIHHAEVLDNCRRLKDVGIKKWAKLEEERWLCPQCQSPMSWYDTICSRCGAARSERLFKMPKSM
jgi:hypothetical protein